MRWARAWAWQGRSPLMRSGALACQPDSMRIGVGPAGALSEAHAEQHLNSSPSAASSGLEGQQQPHKLNIHKTSRVSSQYTSRACPERPLSHRMRRMHRLLPRIRTIRFADNQTQYPPPSRARKVASTGQSIQQMLQYMLSRTAP